MNAFYNHIELIWWTHCKQLSKYKGVLNEVHDFLIILDLKPLRIYFNSKQWLYWCPMLILVLLYLEETSFLFLFLAEYAKMLVHVFFFPSVTKFPTTTMRLCSERHRGLSWICMKNCNDDETILDDIFHEIRWETNWRYCFQYTIWYHIYVLMYSLLKCLRQK